MARFRLSEFKFVRLRYIATVINFRDRKWVVEKNYRYGQNLPREEGERKKFAQSALISRFFGPPDMIYSVWRVYKIYEAKNAAVLKYTRYARRVFPRNNVLPARKSPTIYYSLLQNF